MSRDPLKNPPFEPNTGEDWYHDQPDHMEDVPLEFATEADINAAYRREMADAGDDWMEQRRAEHAKERRLAQLQAHQDQVWLARVNRQCKRCGRPLPAAETGRMREFCTDACKTAFHRGK